MGNPILYNKIKSYVNIFENCEIIKENGGKIGKI